MKVRYDARAKTLTVTIELKGATVRQTRNGRGGYMTFSPSEDVAAIITAPDGTRYKLRIPPINIFLQPAKEQEEQKQEGAVLFEIR